MQRSKTIESGRRHDNFVTLLKMCLVNECDRITTVTLLKARTISIHISTATKTKKKNTSKSDLY
jgi:hypothetical protein